MEDFEAQLHVQQMVARKGCPNHLINVQVVEVDARGVVWMFSCEPDVHLRTVPRMESSPEQVVAWVGGDSEALRVQKGLAKGQDLPVIA